MSAWANSELQHAITEVLRRSAVDRDFRALALRDGAAAIAKIDARPLPHGIHFRFVDNSGREKVIALPDFIEDACDEIPEAALEQVSGGTDAPQPPPITISGGWSKMPSGHFR